LKPNNENSNSRPNSTLAAHGSPRATHTEFQEQAAGGRMVSPPIPIPKQTSPLWTPHPQTPSWQPGSGPVPFPGPAGNGRAASESISGSPSRASAGSPQIEVGSAGAQERIFSISLSSSSGAKNQGMELATGASGTNVRPASETTLAPLLPHGPRSSSHFASAQPANSGVLAPSLSHLPRAGSPPGNVRLESDGGLAPLLPGSPRIPGAESSAQRVNNAGLAEALPGSPHATGSGSSVQPAHSGVFAAALPGSPHATSGAANARPVGNDGAARILSDTTQAQLAVSGSSINHDAAVLSGESSASQNEENIAAWRKTLAPWGPRIDGLASGLAVVQGAMVAAKNGVSSSASNFVGLASGLVWGASAGASDARNSGMSWSRASNVLGGVAGVLNAAADVETGETQARLAYSSSALWLGSAVANTVDAWRDAGHSPTSRAFQFGANTANIVAASAAAYAAKASVDNESGYSAVAGVVAPVAWFAGSVLANLSARYKPKAATQGAASSASSPLLQQGGGSQYGLSPV
jgi:hypothetical protein